MAPAWPAWLFWGSALAQESELGSLLLSLGNVISTSLEARAFPDCFFRLPTTVQNLMAVVTSPQSEKIPQMTR